MKYHEKDINKSIDILQLMVAVLLLLVAGLLLTIKIYFGQYFNNFSEIIYFLLSVLLMGFIALIPLIAIFSLLCNALGINDLYNHAYDDGYRDKAKELKN